MGAQDGDAAFAGRLLDHIRLRTGSDVTFASDPAPVSGGFDTRIYAFELAGAPPAWSGPLIARVFRDPAGPERARFEGAAQQVIAGLGFPCPRPVATEPDASVLGGAFMIMPRVAGKPLLSAGPRVVAFQLPRILAETHARLHTLDVGAARAAFREAGVEDVATRKGLWLPHLRTEIDASELDAYRPGLEWLESHLPAAATLAVCHLDFHPLNVMFDGTKVTGVIDWANASIGDPAADVAATLVIMEMGPLDAGRLQPAADLLRRWLARRYLAKYRRLRPLDMERVRYYQALRSFAALVHGAARRGGGTAAFRGEYAWDRPAQVRMLSRLFEQVSGVRCPAPNEPHVP